MSSERSFGEELIAGLEKAISFEQGKSGGRVSKHAASVRDASVDAPPHYDSDKIRAVRQQLSLS